MSDNLRIRDRHGHGGLYILGIVAAASHAVVFLTIGSLFVGAAYAGGRWSFLSVLITVAFYAAPMLWLLFLARCCQHKRHAFVLGFVFGTVFLIATYVGQTLNVISQIDLAFRILSSIAGSVLYGLGYGLVCVLAVFLYRLVFSKLADQDGTLCGQCGYCITYCTGGRCSECGADIASATKPKNVVHRLAEMLSRHARVAIATFVVVTALLVWAKIEVQQPYWRFRDRFSEDGMVYFIQPPYRGEVEAYRGLDSANGQQILVIQYYRRHFWHAPRIEVRLGSRQQPSGTTQAPASGKWPTLGTPPIVCRLDGRLVQYVLDHDLPSALVDAMLERAEEVGWSPLSSAAASSSLEESIAPEPFFPTALRQP